MSNHSHSHTKRHPSDIIAIIGFVVIGVIIIWGLIHAARLASPWFNSLFTKPTTTAKTQPLPTQPAATTMPMPVLTQPATIAKPTQTTVSAKPKTPADLSVRIMSITADPYGNGMVEFDIANVGGASSGTWYFSVNLPSDTGFIYFSPPQRSLAPGDHIVNSLQFSQISQYGGLPGQGIVSIQVDPANLIHELNEGNNYASQQVGFSYGPQYTY